MIKFQLEMPTIVVTGDLKAFDDTEIGRYSPEQRKEVFFKLKAITGEQDAEFKRDSRRGKTEIDFSAYKGLEPLEKMMLLKTIVESPPPIDNREYVMKRLIQGVVEWGGLYGVDEKALPCDEETKKIFFGTLCPLTGNRLNDLLVDVTTDFEMMQERIKEEREKNLLSTPDGKRSGQTK